MGPRLRWRKGPFSMLSGSERSALGRSPGGVAGRHRPRIVGGARLRRLVRPVPAAFGVLFPSVPLGGLLPGPSLLLRHGDPRDPSGRFARRYGLRSPTAYPGLLSANAG